MSIPTNYQALSGFRTSYSETELRLAIAIAEAFILNNLGGGSSGGITQSQVQQAIEAATNLNDIEPSLASILSAIQAQSTNAQTQPVSVQGSIPSGNNNIGDVDVATLPVAFNTGASSATTQRVVTASDSPDVSSLSAINGKLPSTLGQKTSADSLAIVPASDYIEQSVGNVAAGTTDSGNLLKVGGVYNTTRPTYTNGQRGNLEISARGGLLADYEDYVSTPNNINTADVGSSTVSGANNQNIITGTSTNNSTVSALFSGNSSFAVLISGTWVGTLQFERTLDGGSTWTSVGAFSAGTNFIGQTTTQNGAFHGNSSSSNGIRVRATAWTSGVASVRILLGQGTGTITIGNPLRLFDAVTGLQASIKGSGVAALGTDTAIVVATRFNQFAAETQLTAPGTTSSLDVTSYQNIRCQIVVANINTSVTVRLEGSNDGTNWDNLDANNNDKVITSNGVYSFLVQNVPLFRTRFNFVSESGGTAATIDVRFCAN